MKCLPQHNSGQREKGHLGQTIDNKRFSIASFQAIAIAIYIAISGLKQVVILLFITPSFKPAIAISIASFPMKYQIGIDLEFETPLQCLIIKPSNNLIFKY